MAAGLSAITDASPGALIDPAKARPRPFALFSFNWNAAACAVSVVPANALSSASASIVFAVIACPPQAIVDATVRTGDTPDSEGAPHGVTRLGFGA
ncbi:hypothetical protein D3C72_1605510 [compost metagenome]